MGAMENWGAMTFRPICLEHLPENSSDLTFWMSKIVIHEVSHMWCGNLVTMEWWNDIWLNEGFANYLEYSCIDKLRPQFKSWEKFPANVLYFIMEIDYPIDKTHALRFDENINPLGSTDIFDSITYNKGASVLRMIEDIMGIDNFEKGIKEYIAANQYKSVTSKDFITIMQKFTEIPIEKFVNSWINLPSYPLVTVTKTAEGVYLFKQRAYDSSKNLIWPIMIKYITGTGIIDSFLLEEDEKVIHGIDKWIKVNYMCKGYYRVLYSEYDELLQDIKTLSVQDRYSILNDSIFHFYQNNLEINDVLNVIYALIPEYEYMIISCVCNFFTKLTKDVRLIPLLAPIISIFFRPIWNKYDLTTRNDSDIDFDLLRNTSYCILIEICKDEEIINAVLSSDDNLINFKKVYYSCLAITEANLKTIIDLFEKDWIFVNEVISKSTNINLLQNALRAAYLFFGADSTDNGIRILCNRNEFFNGFELLQACFTEIFFNEKNWKNYKDALKLFVLSIIQKSVFNNDLIKYFIEEILLNKIENHQESSFYNDLEQWLKLIKDNIKNKASERILNYFYGIQYLQQLLIAFNID